MSTSTQPGLPPPAGVKPYFESPFTLQPYQSVTVAGCIIYTSLLVFARMVTKVYVIKKLNLEDCELSEYVISIR